MKRITKIALTTLAIAALTFGVIGLIESNAGNKVKLHHGNQVISVSTNAVAAHMSHGDTLHTSPCNTCIDNDN